MIKKICIIIFVILLATSCGKKDDPVYKDNTKKMKVLKQMCCYDIQKKRSFN